MEDLAKDFKQRLSDELNYRGFGIKEFAAKVGISVSTLNMYLYRNSIPAADVAVKMAKVLNVTTEYLITGEETKTAKYKVLFSAPNIFEIYSTHNYIEGEVSEGSTWFINSSLEEDTGVIVDTYGDVTETVYNEDVYGIRAVAYIKKNQNVSGGSGTYDDPYTIR